MVRTCGEKYRWNCNNENTEDGSKWTPKDRKRWEMLYKGHEGERSTDGRSTSPNSSEPENSMHWPQIRKRPKKKAWKNNDRYEDRSNSRTGSESWGIKIEDGSWGVVIDTDPVGEAAHQDTVPRQLTHVYTAQLPHLGSDAVLLHQGLLQVTWSSHGHHMIIAWS